MSFLWGKIESGRLKTVTVSHSEEFGVDWLAENVGGTWVPVPDNSIQIGFGYNFERAEFVPYPPLKKDADGNTVMHDWDETLGDWVEVVEPSA